MILIKLKENLVDYMTELWKRFYTSIILVTILGLSIFNSFILTFFVLFCFMQLFFEFYLILKKWFNNNNLKLYVTLIFVLIFLFYNIYYTWFSLINETNQNQLIFFLIISITISTDIGGFVFGKTFKGKKLSKYSPNKTYSGMFGSYLLSILTSFLLFKNIINLTDLLLLTLIISTASQLGDLSISFIKRKSKLKDTGNILPGHGGLLDRFDGLILAIPIGSLSYNII